jgi:peptide/nickel transport system substrate-binding protein
MALDRQEIVKKTIGQFDPSGAKVLGNRALVPGQPGYQDNTPAQYKTRDVAGAKKLLQQAGYTFSGDKLTKNGRQVSLLFTTTTNNALRKSTQEIVQNQLADIGIKVNIKQYPAETFFGALKDQGSLTAGDFDMGLFAWVSSPELNSSNTLAYSCVPGNRRTDGMNNYGLGCDPKAQKMIDGVQTETDQTQIEATWNKIDQQLWTDVFTIPLYQKATVISYSDKYKGIGDNTTLYGPFWNSQTWSRAD